MAFKIVKNSSGVQESANKAEVMIESQSDLNDLPANLAVGSVAYTASLDAVYMKGIDGAWTEIGG